MQVVHTAAVPPSRGSSSFATIGCTINSRLALVKMPIAYSHAVFVILDLCSLISNLIAISHHHTHPQS
jgi:hypothetical protein